MSAWYSAMKVLERTLLLVGATLVGWTAAVMLEAAVLQRQGERRLDRMLARAAVQTAPARRDAAQRMRASTFGLRSPLPGELVGRIEMPRLGLRAVVHEGIDGRTLLRAVGHIPGTAFPGTHGTVGLAAHRDSYFRALKDAREGDELFVTTPSGRIRYVVHDTRIVQPADVWVLEPTPQESVTLVTCYPFSYVGVAPERFVVRARREDATLRSSAIQAESGDRGTARSAVPMSAVAAGEGPPSQVRAAKKRAVRLSAGRPPDSASAAKGQKKPKGSNRGFWKTLLSVLT